MSNDDIVSAPPPSSGIVWEDHKGKLLIIEPLSWETDIQTAFGLSDATKANIYVLTGPDTAEEYREALIFPKILASQTKSNIGRKVVGRLGQGNAKPGQSAPWLLEEALPDDLVKAKAYLEKSARSTLTSAEPPF